MPNSKRKILVVCSQNKLRSRTAEDMFRKHKHLEVHSAGTSPQATHVVSSRDIEWAEKILCMEHKHKEILLRMFGNKIRDKIQVADIPDDYEYMDPELQELLEDAVMELLTS